MQFQLLFLLTSVLSFPTSVPNQNGKLPAPVVDHNSQPTLKRIKTVRGDNGGLAKYFANFMPEKVTAATSEERLATAFKAAKFHF